VNQTLSMQIQDESDVTPIRAKVRQLTKQLGFGENDRCKIDICLIELANNVLFYAGKGTFSLELIYTETSIGLQITCSDQGPGIENCERALTNGWSTGGSLGLGLPSVYRLADEFEIHSNHNEGTTIIIKKWLNPNRQSIRGDMDHGDSNT